MRLLAGYATEVVQIASRLASKVMAGLFRQSLFFAFVLRWLARQVRVRLT